MKDMCWREPCKEAQSCWDTVLAESDRMVINFCRMCCCLSMGKVTEWEERFHMKPRYLKDDTKSCPFVVTGCQEIPRGEVIAKTVSRS